MKKLLFLLLIITLFYSNLVVAQDVKVGIYVINLGKFDVTTGNFSADFYLDMKCSTPCDSDNFEFMNGKASSIDKIIDTNTEKFYRVRGDFSSPVYLEKFPFDKQNMKIIIEDKRNTIDSIRYVADKKNEGLSEEITFAGWEIDGFSSTTRVHEYKIYDENYSQYIYNVEISKIFLNSFLKTLLPILFIVMVVLFSFILDPDKITTRLAMVGSSLVASVMFHVSISNQIPPVSYSTFADKFMLLTYIVLVVSFLINIVLLELIERKNEKLVNKIHRATEFSMFIIVPLLYILLFLVSL